MSDKANIRRHLAELERQDPPPPTSSTPSNTSKRQPAQSPTSPDDASPHEHEDEGAHTPPPYSGPSVTSLQHFSSSDAQSSLPSSSRTPQRYQGLPAIDYRLYSPPMFELSSDAIQIKSSAAYLSTNHDALAALIRSQATVPPKPQIHIKGNRSGRVDFDLRLNLLPLFIPEDSRRRMDYLRCVGPQEMALRGGPKPSLKPIVTADYEDNDSTAQGSKGSRELDEWCKRFVYDQASVKEFILERVVSNFDSDWLDGQIRTLVASTGYRGIVDVTFLTTHRQIVVRNPDKVNEFFTGITALFSGKRTYEVVKAVWPFATDAKGEPGRVCATISEEAWWKEWAQPIRYCIAMRRRGWVTVEDKMEAVMEGKGQGVKIDWGFE